MALSHNHTVYVVQLDTVCTVQYQRAKVGSSAGTNTRGATHTHTQTALTRLLCVVYATEEDGDEPLEGVLVHGVNIGKVRGTEEEDLCPHCHWDVPASCGINVLLCLLCRRHFGLSVGVQVT